MKKSDCYRRAFTEVIASVTLSGNTKDTLSEEIVETLALLFRDYDNARREEAAELSANTEEQK